MSHLLSLVNIRQAKALNAIDRLVIISELSDNIKRDFLEPVAVSILLYGCTSWTPTKHMEKKPGGNYTRMLRAIVSKSWKQHLTAAIRPPVSNLTNNPS